MATGHRNCSSCGQQRYIEVRMTVKAGPVLTLLSCNACENRRWLLDGETASVNAVLAAAAGEEDFVLVPRRRALRRQAASVPPAHPQP
jgi:hypothetical protein